MRVKRIPSEKNAVPSPQPEKPSSSHRRVWQRHRTQSIGAEGCEGTFCVSQLAGDKMAPQETQPLAPLSLLGNFGQDT